MKKLALFLAFAGFFSLFPARADTFEYSEELLRGVRGALNSSPTVRSKAAGPERTQALFDVCARRMRMLNGIAAGKFDGEISQIVNRYAQSCSMSVSDFEIVQLRRSKSLAELSRNASSIATAYRVLRDEASRNGGKSKKSKSAPETKKKKFSDTRENRKIYTKKGSSKRK